MSHSPDNLVQYRKRLHNLLHTSNNSKIKSSSSNSNPSPNVRFKLPINDNNNNNIPIQNTLEVIKPKIIKLKNNYNERIKEYEKIIIDKDEKILQLNNSNLIKSEKINNLQNQLIELNKLLKSKDEKINNLENMIIKMQQIIELQDNNLLNDDSIDEINERNENPDNNSNTNNYSNNNIYEDDYNDNSINLNTQQLIQLDLNNLSYLPINNKPDDLDDINSYLFDI
ncbi:hypothetical protein DAPK24_004000 [Pichia kluyveri]|uniref:Uncharacterized protein n=1 Tax=Pichia kluyveri TaxID=36015 RepID=A0AAV5QXD7_PICKL|nr:hypothetical protein DAPK24_004000 [Pichia kluyveri]